MKINCRGHRINEEAIESYIKIRLEFYKSLKIFKDNPNAINLMLSGLFPSCECYFCGKSPEFTATDQEETFTADTECPYKNGFPPIEVNLEIPSGEILLFNDFRHCYQEQNEFISINNLQGQKLYTEHYAKQGLAMHFVGNSCPDVIQINDEKLEIGHFGCEKEDGCTLPECPMPTCNRPKKIGSICTDLWWYCAVDCASFEKIIGKTTDQYEEEYHASGRWPDIVRAKVIPGTYRTVGQYHIDSDKLYSYIERIRSEN